MSSHKKDLQKLTLKECKHIISELMENYADEMPITIDITHGGQKESFELVPKNFKHRTSPINLKIQTVTTAEIEKLTKPGLYIAQESYQMTDKKVFTNFYGLFVDPEKKRDLRYFQSEDKCIDWLKKKIKTMHS